jgi:hypothetical protein
MLILGIELTWFDLLYLRDHDPTFDRVLTSWLTRTRRKEAQTLPLTSRKTKVVMYSAFCRMFFWPELSKPCCLPNVEKKFTAKFWKKHQ